MELRLEIKLASVEELSTIAKALKGLHVGSDEVAAPKVTQAAPKLSVAVEEVEEESDGMIDVESPYTAHPSEVKTPAAPKEKAPSAAEKKAAKKAQDEADRADRVARLKASMEENKKVAAQALANNPVPPVIPQSVTTPEETAESITEEIKSLGDKLMSFSGVPLEAKQKLTADIMSRVGVPQGVRPTQLQQPMLGQFRDMYRSAVEATVNPVMGGLV